MVDPTDTPGSAPMPEKRPLPPTTDSSTGDGSALPPIPLGLPPIPTHLPPPTAAPPIASPENWSGIREPRLPDRFDTNLTRKPLEPLTPPRPPKPPNSPLVWGLIVGIVAVLVGAVAMGIWIRQADLEMRMRDAQNAQLSAELRATKAALDAARNATAERPTRGDILRDYLARWDAAKAAGQTADDLARELPPDAVGRALAAFYRLLAAREEFGAEVTAGDWLHMAALLEHGRGNMAGACEAVRRAQFLAPDDAALWVRRGRLLWLMHEFLAADAELSRAIDRDPTVAEAFLIRGRVRRQLGTPEAALADFNQAITLADSHAEARLDRANLRLEMGLQDAAFADFDKAVALAPESARCVAARGIARAKVGDQAAALADLNLAIVRDALDADALAARAGVHAAMGRLPLAEADFDRALDLRPRSAVILTARGEFFFSQGRLRNAVADFEQATKFEPRDWRIWSHLGRARSRLGDATGAIDAWRMAHGNCEIPTERAALARHIREAGGRVPD